MVNDERVNLGLNLKFEAKKLKVLGYSRRGPTGWEFSQKAIDLVRLYMIKFPEFIAGIQRNTQGNIYEATDFYSASEAFIKVKQIQSWLKEIQSKSFEKVPLEAEQLDSEVVLRIEQAADNAFQIDPPGKGANKKIKGTPRNALLKPSDAVQRLSHQRFSLGDRVVYVQDSGRVPIATRGTVVGKTRTSRTTLIDVLFDVTFMSGTSLEDRCSPFRGSTVPLHSILNLTDRQLVAGSRATEALRPPSNAQPLTVPGYGAPIGPNGLGQLKPAPPPAPLHGSFRSAAAGQHAQLPDNILTRGIRGGTGYIIGQSQQQSLPLRAGPPVIHGQGRGVSQSIGTLPRGRGNASQRSAVYTNLEANDVEGSTIKDNPSFKPKSYVNVPPPATLNSRGQGRGGRGRPSRGAAPRGRGNPSDRFTAVALQQN